MSDIEKRVLEIIDHSPGPLGMRGVLSCSDAYAQLDMRQAVRDLVGRGVLEFTRSWTVERVEESRTPVLL